MSEIPTDDGLGSLDVLRQYGYTSAEEVFYLAQALGPELTALIGIPPIELQNRLSGMIAQLPGDLVVELEALELALGVPVDIPPPSPLAYVFAPVKPLQPGDVNLVAQMSPIRNQAQRGTCVAHASVAVLEHRFGQLGAAMNLSEQFLYWDCKQNDGIPTKGGTWLRVAFPLIARDGVPPGDVWQYQPTPCATEDCGPPPIAALSAALPYRTAHRQVPKNSVEDVKGELATGHCVAFSIPVFRSWFRSNQVRADGKINMPLPNDILEGGHAMCLVGYQASDDPGIGGGRFILRNSWGTGWAPQSPVGPGYGSIPYAYVARYCTEAFTLA